MTTRMMTHLLTVRRAVISELIFVWLLQLLAAIDFNWCIDCLLLLLLLSFASCVSLLHFTSRIRVWLCFPMLAFVYVCVFICCEFHWLTNYYKTLRTQSLVSFTALEFLWLWINLWYPYSSCIAPQLDLTEIVLNFYTNRQTRSFWKLHLIQSMWWLMYSVCCSALYSTLISWNTNYSELFTVGRSLVSFNW